MKAFNLAKWIWLHKENKKDEYGLSFSNFGFMGNSIMNVFFPEIFLNIRYLRCPFGL